MLVEEGEYRRAEACFYARGAAREAQLKALDEDDDEAFAKLRRPRAVFAERRALLQETKW